MNKPIERFPWSQKLPIDDMWNIVAEVGQPDMGRYIVYAENKRDREVNGIWTAFYDREFGWNDSVNEIIAWMELPQFRPNTQ